MMKNARILVLIVFVLSMLFAVTPVLADCDHGACRNPSVSGGTHGAFADQNDNFGWLGPMGGTPGYHEGAVGQQDGATGDNNSEGAPWGNQSP